METNGRDDPFAAVEAFRCALSAGDGAGITAAHLDGDVTIIDNVAPFIWSGPDCVATWLTAMAAVAAARGLTDQHVAYGAARVQLTDGDDAYALYPAEWTYCERGELRREEATIAFALKRSLKGWRIAGWSWNPSS